MNKKFLAYYFDIAINPFNHYWGNQIPMLVG